MEAHGSMATYRIAKESTLHLVLRLRGGGAATFEMADLAANRGRQGRFSARAPAWRNVAPGVTVGATCTNPGCVAVGSETLHTFDDSVVEIGPDTTAPCPMCATALPLSGTVMMFDCAYTLVGTKADGTGCTTGWRSAGRPGPEVWDRRDGRTKVASWRSVTFMVRVGATVDGKTQLPCVVCGRCDGVPAHAAAHDACTKAAVAAFPGLSGTDFAVAGAGAARHFVRSA